MYAVIYARLANDAALAALLGGTATDTRIYPVADLAAAEHPAVGMTLWNGPSDVGLPIDRPVLDLLVVSRVGADEVEAISSRIDALLDRANFSGSGVVVHLARREYVHDDFRPEDREFGRDLRYGLIVQ